MDNLLADLETLNIKWFETNIEQPNKHGGYKIAFFCDDMNDFYILRQNMDSSWSGEMNYFSKITQLENPKSVKKYYRLVKTLEIVKPTIK